VAGACAKKVAGKTTKAQSKTLSHRRFKLAAVFFAATFI
jgi:hypothetical protein